jgi:hypothetical protein
LPKGAEEVTVAAVVVDTLWVAAVAALLAAVATGVALSLAEDIAAAQ